MTKKLLSCLIATIFLSSCNKKTSEVNPPTDGGLITYDAQIPDYEKLTLNTYEVSDKARINESTASANVKKLLEVSGAGMDFVANPDAKTSDMMWFKNVKDPSAILNINLKNGDISMNRGTMQYMGNKATPDLLKEDEAVKMAKTYLTKMGVDMGDEKSMYLGHVGGVNMGSHDEMEGNKIYEKFTTVRFDRKLDNIPILGHSRIIVQMAEKGKLQGLIQQWAPMNPTAVKPEAVLAKDQVKKSIEEHLLRENEGVKKITIRKINLVYYDDGKGVIEPALHVICDLFYPASAKDSTLKSFKYDTVEPLLKNPRIIYTFMAEKHDDHPKPQDGVDNNEPLIRGQDEKR